MESQRSFLLIGLAMVGFLLWQQWQVDYGPKPVQPIESQQSGVSQNAPGNNDDVPVINSSGQNISTTQDAPSGKVITVTTDTLKLSIDTKGGDVISANLVKFPVEQGGKESYSLLRPSGDALFIAQSGLIGKDGTDSKGRPSYSTSQQSYIMEGDTLTVPLSFVSSNGLQVTKNFIFTKDSHNIFVNYTIQNTTSEAKQVQQFGPQFWCDLEAN